MGREGKVREGKGRGWKGTFSTACKDQAMPDW